MTWAEIASEVGDGFGELPLPAYSEFMPPPWVGLKPAEPTVLISPALGADGLAITEYEEAQELVPGLAALARHLGETFTRFAEGKPRVVSATLLDGNSAWTPELAAVCAGKPVVLAMPLALSRTQDDKGRVRWTLFGTSHLEPATAVWHGLDEGGVARLAGFLAGVPSSSVAEVRAAGVRVLADVPAARALAFDGGLDGLRTLVTLEAFARLPDPVRAAVLAGRLILAPSPASLVAFEHPGYARLAHQLPYAAQIPLLHLVPRAETLGGLRVLLSGWLDERPDGGLERHRAANTIARPHRFDRAGREVAAAAETGEKYDDRVSVALFSRVPDDLGLYGKPMARNVQVWTEKYQALLDGPNAERPELVTAAEKVLTGQRFGYRLFFPPMRAGRRSLFWHRPLVARFDPANGSLELMADAPLGLVTAERDKAPALTLAPRVLDRPGHRGAATLFPRERGRARQTTANNARKILEKIRKGEVQYHAIEIMAC
ncbi:MAG: hypothetical protein V1750_05075, partial [Acidobacteriota bacterium]